MSTQIEVEPAEQFDPERALDQSTSSTFSNVILYPARPARGIESELRLLAQMRGRLATEYSERIPVGVPAPASLIWRFMFVTGVSVSMVVCGLVLLILATVGDVAPNPYIGLALLLGGAALCATLVAVVFGERRHGGR